MITANAGWRSNPTDPKAAGKWASEKAIKLCPPACEINANPIRINQPNSVVAKKPSPELNIIGTMHKHVTNPDHVITVTVEKDLLNRLIAIKYAA